MKRSPLFRWIPFRLAILVAPLIAAWPQRAHAQSGTWNADAADNWSTAARWTGSIVADGASNTANFVFNITAARTVTLDTARTIGHLVFEDLTTASSDWTIDHVTNVLTLDVASGASTILVRNRTANLNVALDGNDGITAVTPVTTGGVLSLGGTAANIFTNVFTVQSGATVAAAKASAFGATGAGNHTVVNAGGTININAQNLGTEEFRIAGFGSGTNGAALLNNGAAQLNALSTVILTGNAAVGGSGRFDLRNGTPLLDLAGFRLSKFGANQVSVVGGSITPGNIDVVAGTFSTETAVNIAGAGLTSVGPGATLGFWNNTGDVSRPIALHGGSLSELGSGATATIAAPITVSANSTINVGGAAATNFVLNGNITESTIGTGLTKTGAGRLTLGGTSTFTGPLTVANAGGTVALAAGARLSTTIFRFGDDAVLDASAAGGLGLTYSGSYTGGHVFGGGPASDIIGNLSGNASVPTGNREVVIGAGSQNTARTLNISGNGQFTAASWDFDLGNTTVAGAASDIINFGGTVNAGNVNSVWLRPAGGQDYVASSGFAAGTYTLINSGATLTTNSANWQVANASNYRQTFTMGTVNANNPGAGQVTVTVAGAANPALTWDNGAATGIWNTNGATNWAVGDKFFDLDGAVFGATGAGTVTIPGTVVPSRVNLTAGNYTFTGPGKISGPGALNKSGTGRSVMMNEFSDFTGGTNITGGTLAANVIQGNGTASSLGTGAVNIDGGILEFIGGTVTTNRTTTLGAAGGTIKVPNALVALTLSTAVADTAGSGAGARNLVKTGPGVLTISAVATWNGGVDVNEGVLRAGSNTALGTKAINVAPGATFDNNGQTGAAGRPTLNIAGSGMPGAAAIWNSGGAQTNNPLFGRINLNADSTFGTPVRYDLNGGAGLDSTGTAGVTINANTFNLTKVGSGESWWAPNASAVLNGLTIAQGRVGVQATDNLGTTASSITVRPAGELSSFSDVTNNKPVILAGGNLASAGGGAVGQIWRGGTSLTANSFLDNRGTGAVNQIILDSASAAVAPFTLGGFELTKLGSKGTLFLRNNGASPTNSGSGNLRLYAGAVTVQNNYIMDGAGQLILESDGQLNLDGGAAGALVKQVKFEGGVLNNAAGSHTIGTSVVGGGGRVLNSAAGTTLTMGDISVGANNGIQFGTTGSVALTTINGGAPVVGLNDRLGVNWTAGPAPGTTGFATLTTGVVGVLPATNTNFAPAPTAADDVQVTAATTLASSHTIGTLVTGADVSIPTGFRVTVNSGGIVMRGADHSINTAAGNTGQITSGSADGRLVINDPEHFDTRGSLHLRAQVVNNPLPAGGFTPLMLVKNGPGPLTNVATDNGGGMLQNVFSGGTVINGGRVQPVGPLALGTGPLNISDGGQIAAFNLTGNAAASFLPNNMTATGRGQGENAGYLGAIRMGGTADFSGNVAVSGDTRIHNQNGASALSGVISGSGTLQFTGNNGTWVTNTANTFNGVVQLGERDQLGAITVFVTKLANGGQPSSIGMSSSAASNLTFGTGQSLRYAGTGDSTDRLFTLGGGYNINATPSTIVDGGGYGGLNFTNTGNLAFTEGSYRQLILRSNIMSTGANLVGGVPVENKFAPNLGDPSGGVDFHGFGQLRKENAGLWTLTSNQTYSGTTTINDGWLRLGDGGTAGMVGSGINGLGPNTVTIENAAKLQLNRSNTFDIPNTIVGASGNNTEVVQMGSGTARLTGQLDNSSTRVRVESGILELAKESNINVHSAALAVTVNGGTLRLGGTGNDQIFDGATSGIWSTVRMNSGTFDMNGRDEAVYRVEGSGGTITNTAAGTTSTLTLGGSLNGTGNGSSLIRGGTGSVIQNGAGTVAVQKNGTGSIALTGANTYSGTTTVNNGVLSVGNGGSTGSPGTGNIVIAEGATLAINRSNAFTLSNTVTGIGTLLQAGTGTTTRSIPLPSGLAVTVNRGGLNIDLAASNNVIASTSLVTLNGGQIIFRGGAGGTSSQTIGALNVAGGDVRVDATAGLTTVNLPGSFGRLPGGSVNFSTAGATAINSTVANTNGVVGTAAAAYATFNGTGWAAQNAGAVGAYAGGYAADAYAAANHTDVVTGVFAGPATTSTVRFNVPAIGLNLGGSSLTLNQGGLLVTPAAGNSSLSNGTLTGGAAAGSEVVVHQHNTLPFTVSAVIANNGVNVTGLTKAGSGTLILTADNTYSGETHINQGTLQVGSGGTSGLPGTGPVYNNSVLSLNRSDTITLNNEIAGPGEIVHDGTGTTRLNGSNTFTGGLTISKGTVSSDRGFGGNQNPTSAISLAGGTAGALANTDPANGAGIGPITLGDANTGAANIAFLSESGADFANPIIVSASGSGTVSIGSSSGAVGSANPAFFSGPVTLNRATTLTAANGDRTTFSDVISGNVGTLTIAGGQRVTLEGDNTFTGDVSITGANTVLQVGTGNFSNPRNQIPDNANVTIGTTGRFRLNGDGEIIGQLNSTATDALVESAGGGPTVLTVANGGTYNGIVNGANGGGMTLEASGGTLTIGGTVDNNTGRLLATGSSTMVLAKTSTTGVHAAAVDLTINTGATVKLGGSFTGALPSYGTGVVLPANFVDQIYDGSNGASSSTVINGGTFDLNGLSEGLGRLDGSGGTVTNNGGAAATLFVGTTNHSNLFTAGFGGNVQDGASSVALNKIANGIAVFFGNLTHTGGTTITAGALQIGNGGATGSITGNINLASALTSSLIFNRTGSWSYTGGLITGSGQIIQNGAGTTIIGAGAHTISGAITVNAGDFRLASAVFANADVTLNPTGTLSGTGTVRDVAVNGGILAPGASPGLLNTGSVVTSTAGGSFVFEVGGLTPGTQHDQISSTGQINLGLNSTLVVSLINGFAPLMGDRAFLWLNDAADTITGTFVSLPNNSQINIPSTPDPGDYWTLRYNDDSAAPGGIGNDMSLTYVPEPSSALLAATAALAGLRRRRRSA